MASKPPDTSIDISRMASKPPDTSINISRMASKPPDTSINISRMASKPPDTSINISRMASKPPDTSIDISTLVDQNNPEEVQLFVKRQSILDSRDFITLKDTLRRLCLMYKEFKTLTPTTLNAQYKRLDEANHEDIPYKKALFDDLVTFLKYLPYHIEFCGEPSMECEIKAVVPKHLEHLAKFFKQDRANRIPGYDINGRRVFFLEYKKQWEIIEYVLKHPLGVPYEDIEEKFISRYQLDEKYEMERCEHLLHFMKHTDIFGHKGMVFHQIYFDEKRRKHLYLNTDGTLNEEVVRCLKARGVNL